MNLNSSPRRPLNLAGAANHQGSLIRVSNRHRLFRLLLGPSGEVLSAAQWAEHPVAGDGRAELEHLAGRLREALTLTEHLAKTA